jgi:hypothetical protein
MPNICRARQYKEVGIQLQKSKKVGFLNFCWIIGLNWIFSSQSNNPTKIQKSNFFGFLELDLVGFSIIHPVQNPEINCLPSTDAGLVLKMSS